MSLSHATDLFFFPLKLCKTDTEQPTLETFHEFAIGKMILGQGHASFSQGLA